MGAYCFTVIVATLLTALPALFLLTSLTLHTPAFTMDIVEPFIVHIFLEAGTTVAFTIALGALDGSCNAARALTVMSSPTAKVASLTSVMLKLLDTLSFLNSPSATIEATI